MNYSAIGDGVNLASRLEGLNKEYGTWIMVSEATYQLVQDHFECRLLDEVIVKGKTQPVRVYELIRAIPSA
jgi:adenylate cyclase